uniref:Protein kinase domain-containing protein n=1 Tax=Meloidogyne javanica TaxID=6303 RepID=A0A915MSH5_MELJA
MLGVITVNIQKMHRKPKAFEQHHEPVTCPHGKVFRSTKNFAAYDTLIRYEPRREHIIGRGKTAVVYHAYWPAGGRCIAYKISQSHLKDKEDAVHLDIDETNFIAVVDENYEDEIIWKLKGFGYSALKQDLTGANPYKMNQMHLAPEIRRNYNINNISIKLDVWTFGLMICQRLHRYKIPNEIKSEFDRLPYPPFNYTEWDKLLDKKCRKEGQNFEEQIEKLDRIIKGCLQLNPDDRPTMYAIVRFMDGECHGFNYERDRFSLLEGHEWCEDEDED